MPFRQIVGHRRLLELLSRSVDRDSLPQSLVFSGPDGVGKRLAAVAVAQALNCLKPVHDPAYDACGVCSACRRIMRGAHPDVLLLEPDEGGSIKVEQARALVDRVGFRPFDARRRVVIVDPADALGAAAQNALLKTLEEPPSASVFILVTALPDALLPTVRSRCPQLRFGPLAPAEIVEALMSRHRLGEEDARARAAVADGSLGRALAAGAGDLAEVRAAALEVLREAASGPRPVRRLELALPLARKRSAASSAGNERDDVAVHLRALGSLLRDATVLSARGQQRALANADLEVPLQEVARSYGRERALRAFRAVDRALGALEQNASPKIVLDWLGFQV